MTWISKPRGPHGAASLLFLLALVVAGTAVAASLASYEDQEHDNIDTMMKRDKDQDALVPRLLAEGELESEPVHAILFPWFMQALGLVAFFLITRYAKFLPYTAVIFVLGTFIGAGTARLQGHNQLADSVVNYWVNIDSEVLLNVFLPGLIMKVS
jgi:heme O synthase-like polyprenyltransferase